MDSLPARAEEVRYDRRCGRDWAPACGRSGGGSCVAASPRLADGRSSVPSMAAATSCRASWGASQAAPFTRIVFPASVCAKLRKLITVRMDWCAGAIG
jgi:hypothetical protein